MSADGKCRPLSLIVTPGQRADCTRFEAVMDESRVPDSLPADHGGCRIVSASTDLPARYASSNGLIRSYLRRRGIRHVSLAEE